MSWVEKDTGVIKRKRYTERREREGREEQEGREGAGERKRSKREEEGETQLGTKGVIRRNTI